MNIFICDDNEADIAQIRSYTKIYFAMEPYDPLVKGFTSGDDLLNDPLIPDIVFLDIEMPGLNGINTATELIKRNPSVLIIIVTSHLDYLDDAMKIHVFRYLTKPVEKKRLSRSLADAVKIYAEANATAIVYTRRHGPIALKKSDIICIEAEGRYSYVYTKDDKIDSVNSLSEWMNVLAGINKSYNFFQVHRSFIINMNYITNYSPTELSLSNGFMTIPLARRKRVEFKRQYLRHLERIR